MTWTPRLADPGDDAALCALVRDVPMEGGLRLAMERDPDFFAWGRMQAPGLAETFVAEEDGRIVGCGSYVIREGRLPDGSWGPVGCISDLRVLPSHRGARVLPGLGRFALERARDVHGCTLFHTAVIAGNRRVVGTAESRRAERASQPVSRPMTPYAMANVLAAPGRPRREVERATGDDVDEIARFLAAQHEGRLLGYRIDRKLLETRFATWPGFGPESFRLLRDGTGKIVACAAPWDSFAVRRSRVLGWGGALAVVRVAWNAVARAPLPAAGQHVRFATLSHLEAQDDDPALVRDLLIACRREARSLPFVSAFVPEGSRRERALRGFVASRIPMKLYSTALPESEWSRVELSSRDPGFEMALA